LLEDGDGFTRYRLYNRPETFYEVDRVEFDSQFEMETSGRAWTVSFVEGQKARVTVSNGRQTTLSFLESLVIPAAAMNVKVENLGDQPVKLVLVAIKEGIGNHLALNNPIK